MAGLKEWSIDCDGFVVIKDAGIDILDELFEARKPVYVEVTIAGNKYTGSGYIVDYPMEMPLDSAVSFSLSIAGASKLAKVKAN